MDGEALQWTGKEDSTVTALVCIHTWVINIHKSLKYHNHHADEFNLKAALSPQLTADDKLVRLDFKCIKSPMKEKKNIHQMETHWHKGKKMGQDG